MKDENTNLQSRSRVPVEALVRLHHGDCLEIMPTLQPKSIDAIITDPPYMIGAISVGNKGAKSGSWADMKNAAWWYSKWYGQAKNLLKDTGYLATFTNWRSLPTLIYALSKVGLSATSCMVWDKDWIGPAGKAQLRPRYEMVLITGMPNGKIEDRSAPDIYKCKWLAGTMKTTKHAAEKPVKIFRHLIDLLVPKDGIILDPFMGSGTSGIAAIKEDIKFIGIEDDDEWYSLAEKRINAVKNSPELQLEIASAT